MSWNLNGLGITGMPVNLPAWRGCNPYNFMSQWGNQIQFSVADGSIDPMVMALTQGIDSPNHIFQYNPMLLGFGFGGGATDSLAVQDSVQGAYLEGQQIMAKSMAATQLKSVATQIASTITQLKDIVKSPDLSDSQKARLQDQLDTIKALEKEIKEAIKNSEKMSAAELKEIATAFKETWMGINEELSEVTAEIQEEIADCSEGPGSTTVTDNDDVDSDSPANRELTEKEQKNFDFNMTKICDLLDSAIGGPGTNYDKNEEGLKIVLEENINKDTVLELFEKWDETFAKTGAYAKDKDGLIETLMDDCERKQKQEIGSIIVEALAQRALANGTDVDKEVAAARKALKPNLIGFRNDDKIQDAVNALLKKVKEGEAKIKAEKKTTTDKTDTETTAKQQEKIDKETKLFIQDMNECLERDDIKALPTGVEVVKDDKGNFKGFSIRIKGKEYFGKNYLALVAALEKDGRTLSAK